MSTPTGPRVMARKDAPGVLPIAQKAPQSKPASARLKVVVRRLAPGLTEAEFLNNLGDEWRVGEGKVDWFMYKPGKDSKE